MLVLVRVLHYTFVPLPSQPACLGISWMFPVVMISCTLEHCLFKVFSVLQHGHPTPMCPQKYARMTERYAHMMKTVHSLLSIRSTAVVEEPCSSLDELTFGCLPFLTQQLKRRKEYLVVSRQPVLVLVLHLTFVSLCST